MSLPVIFSPEALASLDELDDYIAEISQSRVVAERYVRRLIASCRSLGMSPYRGTARDYIRPGARTTGFDRRVTILFEAREDYVVILDIYYGGRRIPTRTTSSL